ncbi:hypothetical protein Sjap_010758 [Stephania japonica]|uniref:FAS1 domain-containing protein n=1 Tax=Stephania japonica TaxID=461633 RepID=A0AAP0P7F7_9MAGN
MAYSKLLQVHFLFLLLCISICFVMRNVSISVSLPPTRRVGQLDKVAEGLSNAGYKAMARVIRSTFPTLLEEHNFNKSSVMTIFCPTDYAFVGREQPPSLGLLEYHVVPWKLEKEDLESLIPVGSEIDTLLHGRPLVVRRCERAYSLSALLNDVKIKKWNVYNDGNVIVHGVCQFFNPSFDTSRYHRCLFVDC